MKKIIFLLILIFLVKTNNTFAMTALLSGADPAEARQILQKVENSIVLVSAENGQQLIASGVVIEPNLIITSTLVSTKSAKQIKVKSVQGKTFTAVLIAADFRSGLALLKVDGTELTPLKYGRNPVIGDWCALIGAYYDSFPAIFSGLVSSLSEEKMVLNAPAVPGIAGGAVVNEQGELIGIVRGNISYSNIPDYVLKNLEAEIEIRQERLGGNLSYAVPIGILQKKLPGLKAGKNFQRPWLGIELDRESNRILRVMENSPAVKAGLQPNDQLIAINSRPVENSSQIIAELENYQPGDTVSLRIRRHQKEIMTKTTLQSRPEKFFKISSDQFPKFKIDFDRDNLKIYDFARSRYLGVELLEMTPELLVKNGVKEDGGLMISRLQKDSPAEKAGLQVGDIITSAGNKRLKTIGDLRSALNELKENESIELTVYRSGKKIQFKARPEKRRDLSWIPETILNTLSKIFSRENLAAFQEELRLNSEKIQKELEEARLNFEKKRAEIEKERAEIEKQMKKKSRQNNQLIVV